MFNDADLGIDEKLLVIAPTLDAGAENEMRRRLERSGAELRMLPGDPEQNLAWRACVRAAVGAARRVIAVEPSAGRDVDGRYRRELTLLFGSLTAEQRAKWLPCTLDEAVDVPSSARGRSLGVMGSDIGASELLELAREPLPERGAANELSPGCLVLNDHPVTEDAIGFQTHVEAFVDLLASSATQPPIVAAVEGGWGVGKSSFMSLVRRRLRVRAWESQERPRPADADRDPPDMRTVWFNAWSSDGEGAAFSAFALALINDLEPSGPLRLWRRIQLAGSRFDWSTGWKDVARLVGGVALVSVAALAGIAKLAGFDLPSFQGLHEWGAAAGTLLTAALGYGGLKQLWGFFGSPIEVELKRHVQRPDHHAHRAASERHYDDVARILDVYTRGVKRLYVFIDDLDRADPAKVAEVIQAISVILARAGKKLVYVLALDTEKVAAAIVARHKEIAAVLAGPASKTATALDFGRAYLEKLVQLSFRVPPATPEQLSRWTRSLFANPASVGEAAGVHEAVRSIASSLAVNPRRVKQFLNLLHLRMRLLPAESTLTCLQLAKITAAELVFPSFIRDLADSPTLLNELLLGTEAGTDAYRRWSAHTELIELLTAPLVTGPVSPLERLRQDREASLLDLDIEPILKLVTRAPAVNQASPRASSPPRSEEASGSLYAALLQYAREYERIRSTQAFGPQRTATLDRLFDDMARVEGVSSEQALRLLHSGKAGERIAAVATCSRSDNDKAGRILAQTLEAPKSPFERYHALRVAKSRWGSLDAESRRALALTASRHWLLGEGKADAPIWAMTRDLLLRAAADGPSDDLEVTLADDTPVRIAIDTVESFDRLTDRVYFAMTEQVRPYTYGTSWFLTQLEGGGERRLQHQRELTEEGPGRRVDDLRSLRDVGIERGARLRVVLCDEDAKSRVQGAEASRRYVA